MINKSVEFKNQYKPFTLTEIKEEEKKLENAKSISNEHQVTSMSKLSYQTLRLTKSTF